jgi:acetyl esterase
MAEILAMLARDGAGQPLLEDLPPPEGRIAVESSFARYWNPGSPEVHRITDILIPASPTGAGHSIPVRLYDPGTQKPAPCLVYFHGGGWVVCSVETHDGVCRRLANMSGMMVASVDYRLAPEHKFPAPLDDCLAAVRWLAAEGGPHGIDGARLLTGGDSAGANLALSVATLLRDQGGPALKGAVLIYGVFDTDLDTPSYRAWGGGDYFLSTNRMRWFFNHYLRGPEDGENPLIAPVHADLRGLPPLLVTGAEFDPLLDDSYALVDRLRAAAAPHEWVLWKGVTHGCIHMSNYLALSDILLSQVARWMHLRTMQTASRSRSKR